MKYLLLISIVVSFVLGMATVGEMYRDIPKQQLHVVREDRSQELWRNWKMTIDYCMEYARRHNQAALDTQELFKEYHARFGVVEADRHQDIKNQYQEMTPLIIKINTLEDRYNNPL